MSSRKSLVTLQAELLLRVFRFRASELNINQISTLSVQLINCDGGMARDNPVLQLLVKQGHLKFVRRGGRTRVAQFKSRYSSGYGYCNKSGIKRTSVALTAIPHAPYDLTCPCCSQAFVSLVPDTGKYRYKWAGYHTPDCQIGMNRL